jgi:hypothetical protein
MIFLVKRDSHQEQRDGEQKNSRKNEIFWPKKDGLQHHLVIGSNKRRIDGSVPYKRLNTSVGNSFYRPVSQGWNRSQ